MANTIKSEEFAELAFSLKPILDLHGVPSALHYSLVSDVIFQFATFLDDRCGSNLHEDVFAVLDVHSEALCEESPSADSRIAEVRISFAQGRKVEMNLLGSHLENDRSHLMLDLEMALGLRGVHEIESKDIDIDARLAKVLQKKGGIASVDIRRSGAAGRKAWSSVPLRGADQGEPGQTVDWLYTIIAKAVRR